MRAVATAHHNRSLEEFEKVLAQYKTELTGDPIIETHLNDLYNSMLENNLCRIIEPFSCVEIAHLAHLIKLPAKVVEDKLSKMILDRKFVGILDQGAGCLMVYDEAKTDPMYGSTKETIEHMGKVVDLLYKKASKLS
ncbi:hypothetical protein SARC_08207 [Sphaeroforma arctica JP610]|uniref:PCI domain-containing protein n=1 Tax=Sphaeroforma arctica JP610 TaxID=667725 RepID=A0A0L0FRJ5_9EUKA|nr:hypothetical protein SARC_08207 [Sphaeroforma arctica JP610]KNC79395.1 hypothetical protein SARC_08207 [Sphaeroforma arctica JP610]|eukprot:XP_014153297.1 hypothetical protein SARC_08207 [Sphaeroforma arctica JP610]